MSTQYLLIIHIFHSMIYNYHYNYNMLGTRPPLDYIRDGLVEKQTRISPISYIVDQNFNVY